MPCPRTTILSRSVSSETRQGQADFSRRREPIAFRRWSARAQSFLYIYQEGPVGARGKREAFSKRLWKTPLHVCTCSQPFPKRLSRPEFPAFSTIAAASIGHALQHKSDPPKRQENREKNTPPQNHRKRKTGPLILLFFSLRLCDFAPLRYAFLILIRIGLRTFALRFSYY